MSQPSSNIPPKKEERPSAPPQGPGAGKNRPPMADGRPPFAPPGPGGGKNRPPMEGGRPPEAPVGPDGKKKVSRINPYANNRRGFGGPGGGGGRMGGMFLNAKPKNAGKTLLRVFGYFRFYKFHLIVALLLVGLSSVTNLLATYLLKPIIDDFILPGDIAGLAKQLGFLAGVYIVSASANLGQQRLLLIAAQNITNRLRKDLFKRLQSLPIRFYDVRTHGDTMSRFTNDVDAIHMALEHTLTQLFSSVIMFVGIVFIMLFMSPLLFIITLCAMGGMAAISKVIAGKGRKMFARQQRAIGEVNGFIEEIIEGQKEVKVFTHEQEAISEFDELNEEYRQACVRAQFISGIIMPLMGNINNIAYALICIFGGFLTINGSFTIGTLAAYLSYSRHAGQPINQITNQVNMLLAALAGAERVFDLMDEVPEIDEGKITMVPAKKDIHGEWVVAETRTGKWLWKIPKENGAFEYRPVRGDVRFQDVRFSYDGQIEVLKGISLYAKPDQKIAFVGSTGAGKTTITNMLNRFYDIQSGTITYDGLNLRDISKKTLRESLGMVLQDTHLFTGTVRENIRLGRLDATDEEVEEAAKQSNAHSFIHRLPQGYDTILTNDGGNLSQGQRQLLAIARAAVADPVVLVLDEATSSIDTRTERLIEIGMDRLMQGRTVFVIAHRLSTVRNSNAIMVLEHGEIIERGDHKDLLEQKGRYYQLYTGQFELT